MATALFAQEEDGSKYGFSLAPRFGIIYGQALELVYPDGTKAEFLSELRYDIKPVYYFGLQLDLQRKDIMTKPGIFSSLSFKAGIPADSGIHENRDWESIENDALTKFSTHTNKTRQFFSVDLKFGALLSVNSFLYLGTFLRGNWTRFAFTGRDGIGTYAREKNYSTYYPIDDNPIIIPFDGNVIHYRQDWFLFSPGILAGVKILNFTFDLSFQISPLNYCIAKDEHIDRKIIFMDYSGFGLFFEPAVTVSYAMRRIEFVLETSYRYNGQTKGNSYMNSNNTGNYLLGTSAGAGLSLLDASLLVKVRL